MWVTSSNVETKWRPSNDLQRNKHQTNTRKAVYLVTRERLHSAQNTPSSIKFINNNNHK